MAGPEGGDGGPSKEESSKEDKKEESTAGSGGAVGGGEEAKPGGPDLSQFVFSLAQSLSRDVIDTMRNRVFGFDTFFVTDQEPYEGGVLFKGNLRGDSAKAYEKLTTRLKESFGDRFVLFLLQSPQDERPVAVVVPRESLEPMKAPIPEWLAASAFGLVTAFATVLAYSPDLELDSPSTASLLSPLSAGLPAALVFAGLMAVHEGAHRVVAGGRGVELALPYFVPSWQLGSFGSITRITSVVKNRADLIAVAAAGPLAGAAASLLLLVLSLLLLHPSVADGGILVNAAAFHDSVLVGGLAKLVFGDLLVEGSSVCLSPISLASWSALLVNAINCIPAGELDGGRMALGLLGRKWANRLSLLSLFLLGLSGIFNDIALFWAVLVLILQRGPITPQADELSQPSDQAKAVAAGGLVMGVLVYAPLLLPF